MSILITGCAGFIGYHVALARLKQGDEVIGIDNLNDYYDVSLKKSRLAQLQQYCHFTFYYADITDNDAVMELFAKHAPKEVVHLAAQAGVRYSLKHPHAYTTTNVVGFTHVIEACRCHDIEHLVYASTSSVYGANSAQPYRESDAVNHPLTIYSATKKANELIAHAYSHLYGLATTGLRFFTVYGPWGRPDMAFFSFTRDILADKPIDVYNHGHMQRDFTYIDDIVMGISLALEKPATPDSQWQAETPNAATSAAPYRIYNIGYGQPVSLMAYIEAIESALGKKAIKKYLPLQEGDVVATHADISRLKNDLGYTPKIAVQEGVARFVDWYLAYYHAVNA